MASAGSNDTAELEGLELEPDLDIGENVETENLSLEMKDISETDRAEQAARVVVGWLEKLFSIFRSGFRFDPDLKAGSADRLAPAIERRGLASSGPLAVAPELDAVLYGAELIGSGVAAIRAKKAETKTEKPADDAVQVDQVSSGGDFTLG